MLMMLVDSHSILNQKRIVCGMFTKIVLHLITKSFKFTYNIYGFALPKHGVL